MGAAKRHLRRLIAALAGLAALMAALLPPIVYFGLSSSYQRGVLKAVAELEAEHVSALVVTAPSIWKYQIVRLDELLERHPGMGDVQMCRIVAMDGQVIAAKGERPQWPSISGTFLIHDAGVPVARIEVVQTLRPVLAKTLFVALCSVGLAVFVFRAIWVLPTRAVAAAQHSLAESERKYRSLFLGIHEAVLLLAFEQDVSDSIVVEVNPACSCMFSSNFNNLVGLSAARLFGELHQEMTGFFQQVLQNQLSVSIERVLPSLDKVLAISVVPAEKGRLAVIFSDMTEHRAAERQVRQLVSFDFLTGLPNRALLYDRLKQSMAACDRQQCKIAVFFMDIDHFKAVNDSLGHAAGDLLLQAVAKRLEEHLRKSDTIARTGGDEFVIVTMGLHDELNASLVADSILKSLKEPFLIAGRELFVSGSLGISIYPDDAEDVGALLKNADMAMYVAKEQGRNCYHYYSRQLQEKAEERLEIETALRHALSDNLLSLAYQPQVDARSGAIIGMEALLRWNNPDGSPYLSPLQIINVAEKTGLILPIGEWVLHTACRQLRQWQQQGLEVPRVAINISAAQFEQPGLVEMIQGELLKYSLTADCLELELTESMIMHCPEEAAKKLVALKKLGVVLALDDFGTGYSSLSYLKHFPIDRLKIDRSFVLDAPCSGNDAAIVETIISLAHNMGMQVIAEGVEHREHVEFLLERGCHEMQGYYYARPLSVEQCDKILISGLGTWG